MTYRFVFISKHKFFGAKQISIDESQVNIAEPEKTIVERLDRLRYCGGIAEVTKAPWNGRDELDFTKMGVYSRKNGNKGGHPAARYLTSKC